MSIEVSRDELLAIRERMESAEANCCANIGPSPILVDLREGMARVDALLAQEGTNS